MISLATMLTPPSNYAVVQMPDRKYPGVVFQGDSLHSMTTQVAQMQRLLAKQDLAELGDEIGVLLHDLLAIQNFYEQVCSEQGIDLPYFR